MTPASELLKKEHFDRIQFLQNELKSLGVVEPDHHHHHSHNVSGDDQVKELKRLAENIKEVYYQAYKTAYNQN